MQRVEIAQWKSESSGGMQVLRKTLRSDNAALMARALDGQATIYEGTQEPAADMTVRYIMGWAPDDPDTLRGHITSDFQGCTVTRAFMATRSR